jgi:NADH dehydrogenase/NADH:ubiquinone oxidoreductase subunit G
MQQRVNINIDGANIRANKGTSVLDTAIEFGICIPHLCHVPNLSDIGACRLCIVENIVDGRSKITTSCTLNVEEGMTILTNTEKIRKAGAEHSGTAGVPMRPTSAPYRIWL